MLLLHGGEAVTLKVPDAGRPGVPVHDEDQRVPVDVHPDDMGAHVHRQSLDQRAA